jgi:hypothetical protein
MNTSLRTPANTLQAPLSARVAGVGFAAVLTLAMLLGVNTLASVDSATLQMAAAQSAASAPQS